MSVKSLPYAVNPETFEVYERVPDNQWKAKLDAWIESRHARKCSYHLSVLPSPMPYGHIMFEVKRGNFYKPVQTPPAPIWSDGIGALYAGQRVGWQSDIGHQWFHGTVERMEDGQVIVKLWHGGVCAVDPYDIA